MSDEASDSVYYKVLNRHGMSCYGGTLKWSLPKDGDPGKWHEVEGDLVRCQNGLHLISHPSHLGRNKGERVFIAEYDHAAGRLLGDSIELVVRRARLLRECDTHEFNPSHAYKLVKMLWSGQGSSQSKSWSRLNLALSKAVDLAITADVDFGINDFRRFMDDFNGSYWFNLESWYQSAVDGPHGPNATATAALEKYMGRKPFILQTRHGVKRRLYVGARFQWQEKGEEVWLTVTRFNDTEKLVVACSYLPQTESETLRRVARVFKITHEDVKMFNSVMKTARVEAKKARKAQP